MFIFDMSLYMSDQVEFLMQLEICSGFLNILVCCGWYIPQFLTTYVPLKNYVVNFGKLY